MDPYAVRLGQRFVKRCLVASASFRTLQSSPSPLPHFCADHTPHPHFTQTSLSLSLSGLSPTLTLWTSGLAWSDPCRDRTHLTSLSNLRSKAFLGPLGSASHLSQLFPSPFSPFIVPACSSPSRLPVRRHRPDSLPCASPALGVALSFRHLLHTGLHMLASAPLCYTLALI